MVPEPHLQALGIWSTLCMWPNIYSKNPTESPGGLSCLPYSKASLLSPLTASCPGLGLTAALHQEPQGSDTEVPPAQHGARC